MAHVSPLVPDIAPLLQSLQQFTPQARQNRQFQLAGLEQQQALGAEQLQQAQAETKRAQIISLAEEGRANLLGDKADLDFVMKNGAKGLRNRLALLAKDKDPGSADFNDIVKITNIVATDPERGLSILNLELEKTQSGLDRVNQILNRTAPTKFQKTGAFLIRNEDGSTEIAVGSFDPTRNQLTTRTTTIALRPGQLVSPLGETAAEITTRRVEGEKRIAEERAGVELETAPTIASEVETAKGQAKLSSDIVKKGNDSIAKINKNLLNLDRALAALDKGAGVGAIERFLPSVRAASVELDQIGNELALDIVGATTFGALSKGELDLARSTALPTGLNTQELRDFLQGKKVAQEKLRDYFAEQISFLSTPGATIAQFRESKQPGQFQPIPAGDTPEGTIAASPDGTRIVVRNGTWVLQ